MIRLCAKSPTRFRAGIRASERVIAPGENLGRYHLREPLGAGGMSCVYRAYDPVLDREVAIKILPAELSRDAVLRARFHEEARSLGGIEHPNLIRIFSVGQEGPVSYYSMELITGRSLKEVLAAAGRLTVAEAFAVMGQVLSALEAVHRSGIVHRDLKPSNIMLDASGRVVLMDFGLSRRAERPDLTAAGAVLGTPEYMSPEQARGEKADERSDLYSIGAMLYEMLAGHPPFGGKDTIAILRQHVQAPAPPLRSAAPATPADLERIIVRLLAKKPSERYPHVAELRADLGKLAPAGHSFGHAQGGPEPESKSRLPDRAVQELLARTAQAISQPARTLAGPGAGLRWETPTTTRRQRLRTWVAVTTAAVAVAALIVAVAALLTARPKPLPVALPGRASVPAGKAAAPAAGTLWRVTLRDQKQFEGEFVTLSAGPGNETLWVFHLPDGTYDWVPTSKIRMMTQKGGEAP
jgi:serine/threonine-protein kinase